MNRREFLKLLGISTTTFVAFPRAIWTPRTCIEWDDGILVINPKALALLDKLKVTSPPDMLYMGDEFYGIGPVNGLE